MIEGINTTIPLYKTIMNEKNLFKEIFLQITWKNMIC